MVELQNAGGFRTHFEVQDIDHPADHFLVRVFTTYDKSIKDPNRQQDRLKMVVDKVGLRRMINAMEAKC